MRKGGHVIYYYWRESVLGYVTLMKLEGNYLFSGVVSVTLNFHPQGRNVNDVTNEGKS